MIQINKYTVTPQRNKIHSFITDKSLRQKDRSPLITNKYLIFVDNVVFLTNNFVYKNIPI